MHARSRNICNRITTLEILMLYKIEPFSLNLYFLKKRVYCLEPVYTLIRALENTKAATFI